MLFLAVKTAPRQWRAGHAQAGETNRQRTRAGAARAATPVVPAFLVHTVGNASACPVEAEFGWSAIAFVDSRDAFTALARAFIAAEAAARQA